MILAFLSKGFAAIFIFSFTREQSRFNSATYSTFIYSLIWWQSMMRVVGWWRRWWNAHTQTNAIFMLLSLLLFLLMPFILKALLLCAELLLLFICYEFSFRFIRSFVPNQALCFFSFIYFFHFHILLVVKWVWLIWGIVRLCACNSVCVCALFEQGKLIFAYETCFEICWFSHLCSHRYPVIVFSVPVCDCVKSMSRWQT